MEAIDYIKKFKMDQPNFGFNRKAFLEAFGLDLLTQIRNCKTKNPKTGLPPYSRFREIVYNFNLKFKSISDIRIKSGLEPLTSKLWGAFYSNYVVVIREELYPGKSKEIRTKKQLNLINKEHKVSISQNLSTSNNESLQEFKKKLEESSK